MCVALLLFLWLLLLLLPQSSGVRLDDVCYWWIEQKNREYGTEAIVAFLTSFFFLPLSCVVAVEVFGEATSKVKSEKLAIDKQSVTNSELSKNQSPFFIDKLLLLLFFLLKHTQKKVHIQIKFAEHRIIIIEKDTYTHPTGKRQLFQTTNEKNRQKAKLFSPIKVRKCF